MFSSDSSTKTKGIEFYVTLITFVLMIYTALTFIMLAGFGYTTHYQVMKNITTNEVLRKKWNAKGGS